MVYAAHSGSGAAGRPTSLCAGSGSSSRVTRAPAGSRGAVRSSLHDGDAAGSGQRRVQSGVGLVGVQRQVGSTEVADSQYRAHLVDPARRNTPTSRSGSAPAARSRAASDRTRSASRP